MSDNYPVVNSRYCICSNCGHPNYSSLATKGYDSVLIEDKYDVFYLLVMTSNDLCVGICLFGRGGGDYICSNFLRLHVSLGIHGVACVVLRRTLHLRRYSSLPCVSLHSASFQFHSFPVWHDFVGGRAVVFAKIVRQPHLDRSRYSSAQIVFHAVARNAACSAIWALLL